MNDRLARDRSAALGRYRKCSRGPEAAAGVARPPHPSPMTAEPRTDALQASSSRRVQRQLDVSEREWALQRPPSATAAPLTFDRRKAIASWCAPRVSDRTLVTGPMVMKVRDRNTQINVTTQDSSQTSSQSKTPTFWVGVHYGARPLVLYLFCGCEGRI